MPHTYPEVSRVHIGETEIPFLRYPHTGPAIVMIHATGFQPWQWHPIARTLVKTHAVVAPYFCTHREPDPMDRSIPWLKLAEDLARLCGSLALESPCLVGHSMGATVATIATARFGIRPPKMILIEPIFLPPEMYRIKIGVEDHPLASKSIKRRNEWKSRREAEAYLRSKKMFQQWDDEAIALYIEHGMTNNDGRGLQLTCPPANEAALFVGGGQFDPWPLLPEIDVPVLVVEGEQSENKPFIDLKKAASLFPNGSYREIRNAGHLIPMEKPSVIAELIHGFLEDSV